jgi:phosphopantetheinyl transferase (holo-ACP synthase)
LIVCQKINNFILGKPQVEFEGTTKELAKEMGITRVHIAITHDEHYVVANAILEQ